VIDLRMGDCLEILPTLADKSVDAIITDLPYGTTACKWDVVIPFAPMWEQVKRLCKGVFVTTASQPFTSVLIMSALDMFRHEWAWDKDQGGNFANAKNQPLKTHENVVVFSKNGHTYNPIMTKADANKIRPVKDGALVNVTGMTQKHSADYNPELRYPKSVLPFSANMAECNKLNRVHPTQKPVALYEYLIKTYTNAGDTVLDFCMGSGTTGVACVKTGRNFIGIEKQRDYFEIAERRIDEAQMQTVMEFA